MVSTISLSTLVFIFALVTTATWARPNSEATDERGKKSENIYTLRFLA
jgi:hypothetical protein